MSAAPAQVPVSSRVRVLFVALSLHACGTTASTAPPPRAATDVALPRVRGTRLPDVQRGVRVVIERDAIRVGDDARAVVPLLNGTALPNARSRDGGGMRIPPLADALRAARGGSEAPARVNLHAPPHTSMELLFQVFHTAAQAGYTDVGLVVRHREGVSSLDLSVPRSPPGSGDSDPPVVRLTRGGGYGVSLFGGALQPDCTSVGGGVPAVPRGPDGSFAPDELRACVARMRATSPWRERYAAQRRVAIAAEPDLSYQDFIDAAVAVRESRPGAADGFTDVVLALMHQDALGGAAEPHANAEAGERTPAVPPTPANESVTGAVQAALAEAADRASRCLPAGASATLEGFLDLSSGESHVEPRSGGPAANPTVSRCVARAFEGRRGAPTPPERCDFVWTIEGRSGASATPGGDGVIDPGAVAAAIRVRLGAVRGCYERGLERDRTLAGRVVVTFTLAPDGSMPRVVAHAPARFGDAGGCILRVIRETPMPRPTGGSVDFQFPFTFSPER